MNEKMIRMKRRVRMRRSIDLAKKREIYNVHIKDVMMHRLEKDIMEQSVTDSMGQTGF